MKAEQDETIINYKRVKADTGKAALIDFGDFEEAWLPKTTFRLDEANKKIAIKDWKYKDIFGTTQF